MELISSNKTLVVLRGTEDGGVNRHIGSVPPCRGLGQHGESLCAVCTCGVCACNVRARVHVCGGVYMGCLCMRRVCMCAHVWGCVHGVSVHVTCVHVCTCVWGCVYCARVEGGCRRPSHGTKGKLQ